MADEQVKAQLLARRKTLIDSLGRAEAFLAEYDISRDQNQVQLRLSHLDNVWANLDQVQLSIEDMETSKEGRALHDEVRAMYEPRLFTIKANLLTKLTPLIDNARSLQTPHANSTLSGIKLPTIALPEFDGNYNDWLTFHDTFLALIHNNVDVPAIQKFHYLRAAVKGEAAQTIESISISSANYAVAWECLVNRYANEYLLKKRHLQGLFNIPSMKRENASTLHGLVDEFERHIKILKQLGEPTEQWGSILEHLLCTRLHDDTLKAWEDHASTVNDPNYRCLIEFLQRRIRVLESISVNNDSNSAHSAGPSYTSRKPHQYSFPTYASTTGSAENCPVCHQQHPLYKCPKFNELSVLERQEIVNSKRLCHNCLKSSHFARQCMSNSVCKRCNRKHHTLLHPGRTNFTQNVSNASLSSSSGPSAGLNMENNNATTTESSLQMSIAATRGIHGSEVNRAPQPHSENVFLLTAVVQIIDSNGQPHLARALLDSASQPNLITDRLAHLLHLKRNRTNVTILGAGQLSKQVKESVVAQVKSRKMNFCCTAEFLIMDKVTANLPAQNVSVSGWKIPQELFLADPCFNKTQTVDMVLGAKHFYSFFPSSTRIQLEGQLPLLVDSVFGWIVTGSANSVPLSQNLASVYTCNVVSMLSLEDSLERFWQTEEIMVKDNYSIEERQCESHYQSATVRQGDGRYVVRLPRAPDFDVMLGESKTNTMQRFVRLEKRLERNPKLKQDYHEFIQEYLNLGHMRLIEVEDNDVSKAYYLPHHPVIKEASTTTKMRVVFDGSAKTSTGYSLNDALRVGPVIQDDLFTQILRFRTYPIALVSDIAKMYRQVLVHQDDRPMQRIFWRFSSAEPIRIYELSTVTYGLAPSSFLATRTLQQLATDEGNAYPLGGPALRNNFYVDDFIGGAQTIEEAIQLRTELADLLSKGGFILRKWSSNKLAVLQGLDETQIATKSTVRFSPNETIKALGICWEPEADLLRFDSNVTSHVCSPTKRSILSNIAKLYDPLGIIAPIVVRAKILMQELWLLSCKWDDPVPETIRQKWESFHSELTNISSYRVPRYAFLLESKVQLHTFADASEAAYGACSYIRCEDSKGNVKIQLLASKSRVAPLKRLTVPRLELCAAVLAAHLHDRVRGAIGMNVVQSYFWSDSAVTLQWLQSPPNVWQTYVAHRVAEIQHFTSGCVWYHIAGKENPADLVSRGMSVPDFLVNDLWKQGPRWLVYPEHDWPISEPPSVPENLLECKSIAKISAFVQETHMHPWFLRWSSYTKMLHVIAYCMRFVANIRAKTRTQPQSMASASRALSVEQTRKASLFLVKLVQKEAFANEIKILEKKESLPNGSKFRLLSPFIDEERVLRVGGRLNLSQLPYQTKHPVLLPDAHPFTRLLAEHYHVKMLHGGGRHLLTAIREEYWPLQGRRLARSVVRNCFRCNRFNPVPIQQTIGQLPASRVIPSMPFNVTGIDYAGPVYLNPVHRRAPAEKAYFCVFVRFATKAVHIELASDLSTQAFLCAFRRFIARRGRPAHVHSDNGKNFEGAKNEMARLFNMLESPIEQEKIGAFCIKEGITWHLTPPKAPHFGGLWEAAVKTAKRHLFRQLGASRLSFEDMSTILAQIEAQMNSRPLLPLSEDPNDLLALTPGHFLVGTSMNALPDPDVSHVPINRLDHYHKLQMYTQKFWEHWKREYLQELQRDTKHRSLPEKIQPGQMVIVVDELQAPIRWPLARIVDVHPGKDNITRVVSLRTSKGIIMRPTTKICLLPYAASSHQQESTLSAATNQQLAD
ncbi:uncharacterized protein LOC128735203 [Sabethes cyaneus]|uniref:uncharacterized protein LOC128735203 n=1 Tax=Sabethes cyaneus TaxID=53552 RepID=UPI00237DDB36|nr:uncharacterized protein LOC128735203 [Sabethes cyaneus]